MDEQSVTGIDETMQRNPAVKIHNENAANDQPSPNQLPPPFMNFAKPQTLKQDH